MIHINSDISWVVNIFAESEELGDYIDDYFDDGYDTEAFDTGACFVFCGDDDFDYWTLYLTIGDSTYDDPKDLCAYNKFFYF